MQKGENAIMKCPKCGTENAAEALYCANCGSPLEAPAPAPAETPSTASAPVYSQPVYNSTDNAGAQPQQPVQPQQPANGYTQQTYQQPAQPLYKPYGTAAPSSAYTYSGSAPLKSGDPSKDWAAITALVCGIASIPCCVAYGAGLIMGIAAVVFGIIGLKSTRRGMSLAGLICGAVGIVFGIVMVIGMVALFRDPDFSSEINQIVGDASNI